RLRPDALVLRPGRERAGLRTLRCVCAATARLRGGGGGGPDCVSGNAEFALTSQVHGSASMFTAEAQRTQRAAEIELSRYLKLNFLSAALGVLCDSAVSRARNRKIARSVSHQTVR